MDVIVWVVSLLSTLAQGNATAEDDAGSIFDPWG
jgi:hypothetical protein